MDQPGGSVYWGPLTVAARKKLAEARARECRLRAGIQRLPVNVNAIAKKLRVIVRYQPFPKAENVSGCLIWSSPAVIGVNSSHHRNRQRYTIAHELGHFTLNHRPRSQGTTVHLDPDLAPIFRDEQSEQGTNTREIEANAFAAELLMPAELLHEALRERGVHALDAADDPRVRALARQYQVSVQAMTIRLVNLGYLI